MCLKYDTQLRSKTSIYRRHGIPHRIDGPAVIGWSGNKYWLIYGIAHRLDGPADCYKDGQCEYYIMGQYYDKEEYYNELKRRSLL